MIILWYVGNHANDTAAVRAGWAITRAVQTGPFKQVTHSECVHAGDNYKKCTIASSSIRDGGVRVKRDIALTKGNWIALDVPSFSVERSRSWFAVFYGCEYDWLGAIATKLAFLRPISRMYLSFFCNEACLDEFVAGADEYTPSQSLELLISRFGGVWVTDEFFKD